jgi:hypothetical protein
MKIQPGAARTPGSVDSANAYRGGGLSIDTTIPTAMMASATSIQF